MLHCVGSTAVTFETTAKIPHLQFLAATSSRKIHTPLEKNDSYGRSDKLPSISAD